MRVRIVLAALACAILFLWASPALANDASLYFSSDPALLWTEWGLIQDGEAPATAVYPLAQGEMEERYAFEGEEAPVVQNRFGLTLRPMYGGFSLPAVAHLSRTGITLDPATSLQYWSLPPFAEAYDDLSVGESLNLHIRVDQRFDAGKMPGTPDSLIGAYLFESSSPREGYATLASRHMRLTAGRLRSGIGYGYFGNTFLNGRANYYDQVQFTAYTGDFKFFYLLGTSDSLLTPDEQTIQNTRWDFPVYNQPYKTYVYKRLEYHPFPNLLFGVGEANMIGGVKPDIQNINPFGIWHNTYGYGYKNVMAVVDASWVPVNGLHLFGEFLMDELKLQREGSSRKPNAFAWQLGARYVLPGGDRSRQMVGAEYTHVDPWTYNTFQPYLWFTQRQPYASSVNDWYMDIPLGYAYGPDCDQFGFYYRIVSRDGLQASASYSHLVQGEATPGAYDATQPWYNLNDQLPLTGGHVGVAEVHNTLAFSLRYPIMPRLSLTSLGTFSFVRNPGHVANTTGTMYSWAIGVEYGF